MPQLPPHIEELIRAGESETVEFKETTGTLNQAFQTVCAMLNGNGGTVLIGVKDDRSYADFTVGADTNHKISSHIRELIPAAPVHVAHHEREGNRHIIELHVGKGTFKPYTYKRVPYKRVLNTTTEMTQAEYNQLVIAQRHHMDRWEIETAPNMTLSDVNQVEVKTLIDEAVRRGRLENPETSDVLTLLNKLKLANNDVLTRACAVLFGSTDYLERHFPQCKVSLALFGSLDSSDVRSIMHLNGNLFQLLRKAESFITQNMRISSRILPNRMDREDIPQYPPIVFREALANAFCHRDYSMSGAGVQVAIHPNRLEIVSPGPLHFGLTPDDLLITHPSQQWNPFIARTLFFRGVIEDFGTGFQRMVKTMADYGGSPPQLEESASSIRISIQSITPSVKPPPPALPEMPKQAGSDEVDGADVLSEQIIDVLKRNHGGLPFRSILEKMNGADFERVRYVLSKLKAQGRVTSMGVGAGSKWRIV